MKTHLIIVILLLLSGSAQGQKYFKCIERQEGQKGSMVFERLVPQFKRDTLDTTDLYGMFSYFHDENYKLAFLNGTVESVLPKDSIDKLEFYQLRTRRMAKTIIFLTIDTKGKVWDMNFLIPVKDKAILTDEVLYKIYQKFREIQVDMSKLDSSLFEDPRLYIKQAYPIYWWPIKREEE